jgi:hypothetical protein
VSFERYNCIIPSLLKDVPEIRLASLWTICNVIKNSRKKMRKTNGTLFFRGPCLTWHG